VDLYSFSLFFFSFFLFFPLFLGVVVGREGGSRMLMNGVLSEIDVQTGFCSSALLGVLNIFFEVSVP